MTEQQLSELKRALYICLDDTLVDLSRAKSQDELARLAHETERLQKRIDELEKEREGIDGSINYLLY